MTATTATTVTATTMTDTEVRVGRVIVVGSANIDLVMEVERLPRPGETVGHGRFRSGPGGKGLNQAVAAARFGAATAFVGCVGRDLHGDVLEQALRDEGIDTTGLGRTATATGSALILVDARGENAIAVAPGANDEVVADGASAAAVSANDQGVLLLQLEIPVATALAVVRAAPTGRQVLLNIAPAPTAAALGDFADRVGVVIANQEEAGAVTGLRDLAAAAKALRSMLHATAIVTAGARGLAVCGPDGNWLLAAPTVVAVDTVGAGDAFCGVLAGALAQGCSLAEAVRLGAAAGALTATRAGAAEAMPQRGEIIELARSDTS